MDGGAAPDVTLERLHEIADAFARRDVDGIVNSFAEDGEFRNARGPHCWGASFKGKAAIRSYFEPLFASTGEIAWKPPRHDRHEGHVHQGRGLTLSRENALAGNGVYL